MKRLLTDIFLQVFFPRTFKELAMLRAMRARSRRAPAFSGSFYDSEYEVPYSMDDPAALQ
jgi:hypothetical protein